MNHTMLIYFFVNCSTESMIYLFSAFAGDFRNYFSERLKHTWGFGWGFGQQLRLQGFNTYF